jgi:hypothetical protein
MVSTLRELKDTLVLSMGTMNQTLGSMHDTLRSIHTRMLSGSSLMGPGPNYIPAPGSTFYQGGISNPTTNYLGRSSMMDLIRNDRPFNADPREFYTQSMLERDRRLASIGTEGTISAIQGVGGLGLGWLGERAALGGLARMGVKLPGVARFAVGMGTSIAGFAAMQGLNWSEEASNFSRNVGDIRRLSPRVGREMSEGESMDVARYLRRFAMNEASTTTSFDTRLGQKGADALLKQGMHSGLFRAGNTDELLKQFEQAAGVVRILSGVMESKDIIEAVQHMSTLKAMGKNLAMAPQELKALSDASFKYASVSGMNRSQMMNDAMRGAQQIYPQFGMPSYVGIVPMMQSMAYSNELEKRKIMSAPEMAAAGGVQGMARTMTQFYAGAHANPAIGKLMYSAAMTASGQFDSGKLSAAMNGRNYYETANIGLQNVLSGGPARLAVLDMEMPNFVDALRSSDPKDQAIKMMTLKFVEEQLRVLQPRTYIERLAVAAKAIQQIGDSQGTPVDMSSAKALAIQLISPQVLEGMESDGERKRRVGDFNTVMQKNSRFRMFSRAEEKLTEFKETLDYHINARPANAMYSWFNDLTSTESSPGRPLSHDNSMTTPITMEGLSNIKALRSLASINSAYFNSDISGNEINRGFLAGSESLVSDRTMADMLSPTALTALFTNPLGYMANSTMLGSNPNLTTSIQGMVGRDWKDYYDRIAGRGDAGKSGIGAMDAFFKMRDLIKGNGKNEFNSMEEMTASFKDSKYFGKLGGGFHWAATQAYSSDQLSRAGSELHAQFKGKLGDLSAVDAEAKAMGLDKDATAEAAISMLAKSKAIGELAKSQGINARQAAYLYVKERGYGGKIGDSYNAYALDTDKQQELEKIGGAMDKRYLSGSQLEGLERIAGLDVDASNSGLRQMLKDIGLPDGVERAAVSASKDDLQSFNRALAMIMNGEHDKDKDSFNRIRGTIKDQKLKDSLEAIYTRGDNNQRFSKYRGGYTVDLNDPYAIPTATPGKSTDEIAAALEGMQSFTAREGTKNMMTRMWGLNEDQAAKFIDLAGSGEGNDFDKIRSAFTSISATLKPGDYRNELFRESNRVVDEATRIFGYKGEGSLQGNVGSLSGAQKAALRELNAGMYNKIMEDPNMSKEAALKAYYNVALSAGMTADGGKNITKKLELHSALMEQDGQVMMRVVVHKNKAESANKDTRSQLVQWWRDVNKLDDDNAKVNPAGPGTSATAGSARPRTNSAGRNADGGR